MFKYLVIITVFICFLSPATFSQNVSDTAAIKKIPPQYFDVVNKKTVSLSAALDKKSQKALERMQKQESKLRKRLAKIDSLAAENVFKDANDKYKQFQSQLNGTQALTKYIPQLDTLVTSFKFLEQNPALLGNIEDAKEKLDEASSKLKELQSKLQSAEDIKQFLKERKEYLKQQLGKFGFAKQLKKLNKEVYYYSQQINEYKEILKDPKKIERKAIDLLSKTKLFQDFMKKNGILAGLFGLPENPNDPRYQANLAGLQTRTQVNQLVQNQITAGSPNAGQQMNPTFQKAQSEIQKLKDKVNQLGGGSSDKELPDFKPNSQKTKNFFNRLELGTNLQSKKSNGILPVTTDFGLSVGYKINDNSVIGIGVTYKMGWGSGWNNIRLSQQGAGIRTYLDWKIKHSFFISGGYEYNYLPGLANQLIITRGGNLLADPRQQSGLLGISKIVSIKSKFFKKTKMQLLWDFLSYQQVPRSQAILFRIGYNIK